MGSLGVETPMSLPLILLLSETLPDDDRNQKPNWGTDSNEYRLFHKRKPYHRDVDVDPCIHNQQEQKNYD